jgi:hypothetical protein
MVTAVPAPVDAIRQGMTAQGLATQGMELVGSESVAVDGSDAMLLHARQRAAGTPFLKWVLVLGDPRSTHLVVGTYPAALADSLGAQVRRAVLSVVRTAAGPVDPFEGLRFRLDPGDRLKLAPRVGSALMLTLTGAATQGGPGDPFFVAGPSVNDVAVDDLEGFAERRARQTTAVEGLRNLQGEAREIDGLRGYEIVADATDRKSGLPVKLYQAILLEGDGYYVLQGLVGADRAAEYLPEFRRLTGSFRRVPARP